MSDSEELDYVSVVLNGEGGDILQCLPHSKPFLIQFRNSSTREWHDFALIVQSCLDHAIIITIHILVEFKKVALVNWIIASIVQL